MTRPAATRTARISRDDTPWASAGIKIRSPAASGPMRARSWLMTLIICGASWSRIGNNLARSPLPMAGASMATAAGLTLYTSPSSSISNNPTGHW